MSAPAHIGARRAEVARGAYAPRRASEHEHLKLVVSRWKTAYEQGAAGRACDLIVRERPVPSRLLAAVFGPSRPPRPLDERDLAILELVAEGWTNAQVAQRLGLCSETIRVRLRHIYRALEVKGDCRRANAVAVALRRGLI